MTPSHSVSQRSLMVGVQKISSAFDLQDDGVFGFVELEQIGATITKIREDAAWVCWNFLMRQYLLGWPKACFLGAAVIDDLKRHKHSTRLAIISLPRLLYRAHTLGRLWTSGRPLGYSIVKCRDGLNHSGQHSDVLIIWSLNHGSRWHDSMFLYPNKKLRQPYSFTACLEHADLPGPVTGYIGSVLWDQEVGVKIYIIRASGFPSEIDSEVKSAYHQAAEVGRPQRVTGVNSDQPSLLSERVTADGPAMPSAASFSLTDARSSSAKHGADLPDAPVPAAAAEVRREIIHLSLGQCETGSLALDDI
ncbi:hypothetical protein MKZ38_004916 [Zalerion maritima]|uniref:Uncharacterized protein n=1 Tax=Zalerion maritima TaxID=339359 RepID=A0AAD5WWB7_9PEZI|nr:hypothetical protein MKZ38_004916 [Zalerion maritima]